MPKSIERAHHTIDAAGKPPGRLASQISHVLIGKHKPAYVPEQDVGDFVDVVHAEQMRFSGKKLATATYKRHTGFLGGLKETRVQDVWTKRPADVLRHAVSRMLPKNKHRVARLKRLTVKTPSL
jgi:large subunit ribosomal protein L13